MAIKLIWAQTILILMRLVWKKEKNDLKEDEILNFKNDISRMTGGVNILSNSNTKSSDKEFLS